jgi:hypothetical protein
MRQDNARRGDHDLMLLQQTFKLAHLFPGAKTYVTNTRDREYPPVKVTVLRIIGSIRSPAQ